ncbi:MAG: hypothetical protein U1E81_23050 [Xanthobacteraceae bacterium]
MKISLGAFDETPPVLRQAVAARRALRPVARIAIVHAETESAIFAAT